MRDFGAFVLQEQIGSGAMGVVYRAIQKSLDRRVVIKILPPHMAEDSELSRRFEREARAVAKLAHENIVGVIDFGRYDGTPYIAMELIDGLDLRQLMERSGRLPLSIGLLLVRELCAGLAYAHERGIIHRDIKPSNLMLTTDGVLKIMDFGLAREGRESTFISQQIVMGTPAYMSPEQVKGSPANERSDVFAAGIVAYEILGGRKPFMGETTMGVLFAITEADPPPLNKVDASIPIEVASLVGKMIDKDPERRPKDMRSVHAEVVNLISELGIPNDRQPLRVFASTLDSNARLRHEIVEDLAVAAPTKPRDPDLSDTLISSRPFPVGAPDPSRPLDKRISLVWIVTIALVGLALPILVAVRACSPSPGNIGITTRSLVGSLLALIVVVTALVWWRRRHSGRMSASDVPAEDRNFRAEIHAPTAVEAELSPADSADARTLLLPISQLVSPGRTTADSHSQARPTSPHHVSLVVTGSTVSAMIGRRFSVTGDALSIGRGEDMAIRLDFDPRVSRKQATIHFGDRGFWIEDDESANGTWVDGVRLSGMSPLRFGSSIQVGSTLFTLTNENEVDLPDLAGRRLEGRYELTELIRRTVKALTYEAEDCRLPKKVIVQILSPELASFPTYVDDFRRESETAAQLNHPHIAKVLDSGTFDVLTRSGRSVALPYTCVERYAGGSLARRLTDGSAVPLDRVSRWLDQLADAVDHAHRQNIVHGAIKPTAILLDADDNVILTDFAFASRSDRPTNRPLLGAPAYVAPEQWEGNAPTAAADQYSLAVLAYLLVTGAHPYLGQEQEDVRRRNFERGPIQAHEEASRRGRKEVPRAVSAVLARGLALGPEQRYSCITDFAREFRDAVTRFGPLAGVPRVFVSYRRQSGSGWANLITLQLKERHGIDAFLDTRALDSAGLFPERLRRAIESRDIFICLLAANTLESDHVRHEIRIAHANGKPMIPVLQESFRASDLAIPHEPHVEALLSHDGIQLLDERGIYIEQAIDEIARLVQRTLGLEGRTRE